MKLIDYLRDINQAPITDESREKFETQCVILGVLSVILSCLVLWSRT